MKTDVVVIGAGAVGSAIARELSKYEIGVIVVDKNEDVGGDASKSNSGLVCSGYDAAPGSLESELIVAANPMYDKLASDLDVPFKRVGAILPAMTDEQYEQLPGILEKSFENHVYDVEFKTGEELLAMEPNLNPEVKGGLYIPRESIVDPFILVQAMAENAAENGVEFLLILLLRDGGQDRADPLKGHVQVPGEPVVHRVRGHHQLGFQRARRGVVSRMDDRAVGL